MGKSIFLALSLLVLAGCASVPNLHIAPDAEDEQPNEVTLIMNQVACELRNSSQRGVLVRNDYVVAGSLIIKAKESSNVSPSLNFINPLNRPMTSQTTTLNGVLGRARTAQFNQNFQVLGAQLGAATPNTCPSDQEGSGLSGEIGLSQILDAALLPGSQDAAVRVVDAKGNPSSQPAFGTTLEFVFERSIGFGPTWTRIRFRGPNGQTPMFNGARTDTSTLTLAFAPTGPLRLDEATVRLLSPDQQAEALDVQTAEDAQALLNQLLLQNITPR